jgi:hypothetical protein
VDRLAQVAWTTAARRCGRKIRRFEMEVLT